MLIDDLTTIRHVSSVCNTTHTIQALLVVSSNISITKHAQSPEKLEYGVRPKPICIFIA